MLEKQIKQGRLDVRKLVHYFNIARSFNKVPEILGYEEHPSLEGYKKMPLRLVRKKLSHIIYRGDLGHMFRNMKKEMAADA